MIKPPRFGNCAVVTQESKPCLSLQDIQCTWNSPTESSKKQPVLKIYEKLNGLIEHGTWDADDIFPSDHDYSNSYKFLACKTLM